MKKKSNGDNTPTDNKAGSNVPTNDNQPDRLIPLNKWHEYHPWPPIGGMRHIRFFREEKNAAHCFVKKGGRVLVRERQFLDWAATPDAA